MNLASRSGTINRNKVPEHKGFPPRYVHYLIFLQTAPAEKCTGCSAIGVRKPIIFVTVIVLHSTSYGVPSVVVLLHAWHRKCPTCELSRGTTFGPEDRCWVTMTPMDGKPHRHLQTAPKAQYSESKQGRAYVRLKWVVPCLKIAQIVLN